MFEGWGAAIAAGTVVAGVASSSMSASAAGDAADAQSESAQKGIDAQNQQFAAVQKLLQPYVQAGNGALSGQQDLAGLNGNGAQQSAISALQQSPGFTSLLAQGNNNILQNASATGGLRGGNTQAALAQFAPQLLAQTINDQYSRLGGLTSLGQNAAAGVGNAGMANGSAVSSLLQQQGAAQAGAALAGGRAMNAGIGSIASGLGTYGGLGGFGSFGGVQAGSSAVAPTNYGRYTDTGGFGGDAWSSNGFAGF